MSDEPTINYEEQVREVLLKVYNEAGANLWMSAPHPKLGMRSPAEALKAGDGQMVLDYVHVILSRFT
ncbi:MAG: antitoxin Xre/MbcA/ParS toxin-binding domain-containing protein [Rhodococcus sp. (in: high G+C Gram-positive bacteria)]